MDKFHTSSNQPVAEDFSSTPPRCFIPYMVHLHRSFLHKKKKDLLNFYIFNVLKYKRSDFDLDISLILIRLRPDNTSAVKDVLIGVSVAQSALIDYAPQMIMMMGRRGGGW